MKTIVNKEGKIEEKLNLFDKIDRKLEGHKLYDFYYDHIWCPIYRTFYYRPKRFFHKVRMFFQRGRLGYTHEDYWALNCYLADYLAGVLTDWKDRAHSYPPTISGKKFTMKEWEHFLSESAEAFKNWSEWDKDLSKMPDAETYEINNKKIRRFFTILGDNFDTFWD